MCRAGRLFVYASSAAVGFLYTCVEGLVVCSEGGTRRGLVLIFWILARLKMCRGRGVGYDF